MLSKKGIAGAAIGAALACVLVACDTSVLAPKVGGAAAQATTSERAEQPVKPEQTSEGASKEMTSTKPEETPWAVSTKQETAPTSEALTSQATSSSARSVTVTATGSVSATPDRASFTVSVTTEGKTAAEAERAHAKQLEAVLRALKDAGANERDLQTFSMGMYPIYEYLDYDAAAPDASTTGAQDQPSDATSAATSVAPDSVDSATSEATEEAISTLLSVPDEVVEDLLAPSGSERVVGYEMTTTISVSNVYIDDVGGLIDACVEAGVTNISGPSYSVSDYDDAYEQALTEAVDAARAKAQVLAKAAGAEVGAVITLEEGYQNTTYRAKNEGARLDVAAAGAGAYELAPGTVDIEALVTVSYELR